MTDVTLDSLVGEHVLDAVDMRSERIKDRYGDYYEDCEVVRFRLDGVVYAAVEDPEDGYRSSMDRIFVCQDEISNVFPPIRVLARKQDDDTYEKYDVLHLIDVATGKVVLEVGTANTDDYYPSFVGAFHPENMATNQ